MNEEIKNLFRLIETFEEENIELALQLMEGNIMLKEAVEERYYPILEQLFQEQNLKLLVGINKRSFKCNNSIGTWEPSASNIEVLELLPITSFVATHRSLSHFPKWICSIKSLQKINLSYNHITNIPDEIGNLLELKDLLLNTNKITQVPDSITNLTALKKLNLDFNRIKKIPENIGNLTKLEWLCLEKNPIQNLPLSVQNLSSLSWLSVENTPLGDKHSIKAGMFTTATSEVVKRLLGVDGE